ncbi:MAG: transaldolase [Gammaproteobacteria bacterium]|nr:transaldolase [Gammaproteobacteria bacterium]
MTPTRQLHELGQSLWLDNITRTMLDDGTLSRFIADCDVTGLTSNPSIFDKAMAAGSAYDAAIARFVAQGQQGEELFFSLALQDLTRAADLFRPAFDASGGNDGFVSLEVSPLLADDTRATVESAVALHARAGRDNLFIKIPGNAAGIPAIEEAIFRGVPVNVTLLFSREQYLAAAAAWMRGVQRRIAAGRDPDVASVASVFISRWDVAVAGEVPPSMHNRLGIAIGRRTYRACRELRQAPDWQRLIGAGARPQKLLWASTGTKDPGAPDTLYVEALAAPDTINTIPDSTLLAFAAHGRLAGTMPADGGDCEQVIAQFNAAGVDEVALAARLQRDGAAAFVKSWQHLLGQLAGKAAAVGRAGVHA